MASSFHFRSLVVPFDFSPTAHNALFQAIHIGRKTKLPVELWIVTNKYAQEQLAQEGKSGSFKEQSEAEVASLHHQTNQDGPVELSAHWLEGKTTKSIQQKLKENPDVLVFLGVHGERKQDVIFHGNQSNKLSLCWKAAVLAIPPGMEGRFQRMLLTIDAENMHSREKIPYALLLAQFTDAEVVLLGLERRKNKEDRARLRGILHQAAQFFGKKGIAYRQEILDGKNPGHATLRYAEAHSIDLVVLVADADGALSALTGPSFPSYLSQRFQGLSLCVPPRVNTITAKVTI